MEKSIYSLVLSDSVVEAVDELARAAGMSRSSMINQLLAERVGYATPEMHLRGVLASAREAMKDGFYMVEQPTGSTLSCRTSLKYRYKPTVRYSVEIFTLGRESAGRLRAQLRTQNYRLIQDFVGFLMLWGRFEREYVVPKYAHDIVYSADDGKFTRVFNMPAGSISDDELGAAVADYLTMFDAALKAYFAKLPDDIAAAQAARECYRHDIARQKYIL